MGPHAEKVDRRMINPFVIAARKLLDYSKKTTKAMYLRSCIASLPLAPDNRPICAPNYATDLGIRYRNDPEYLLRDSLKAIGDSYDKYKKELSPADYYSCWVNDGKDTKKLLSNLDVIINYAGAWDIASDISKLYLDDEGLSNDVGLMLYMAASLNRTDSHLAGRIYEHISTAIEVYPTNRIATEIRNAARLIKIDRNLNKAIDVTNYANQEIKHAVDAHLISSGDANVYKATVDNIRALTYSKMGKNEEALELLQKARRYINEADGLVALDEDQRLRYYEQITINEIQLLMIMKQNVDARDKAISHCSWVEHNHPASLSEALHVMGYAYYRCNMLNEAIDHWENSATLSACYGRITPLNALRRSLSHAYYKCGEIAKSKDVLLQIETDRSGINLAMNNNDIRVM